MKYWLYGNTAALMAVDFGDNQCSSQILIAVQSYEPSTARGVNRWLDFKQRSIILTRLFYCLTEGHRAFLRWDCS